MTDTNIDTGSDDLSQFEQEFYQKTPAKVEEEPVEQPTDETPEDDDEQVEPLATEQEEPSAEEEDDDPKPKPKKKSVQERFDEITAARREAEREVETLHRRIAELEAASKTNKETKPESSPAVNVKIDSSEPNVDDTDEDGQLKYPLGEFDPNFVRDLTRYEFKKTQAEERARLEQEQAARQAEEARTALDKQWQEKVVEVEKTLPDIRQAGVVLDDAFKGMDPGYEEYLANTIKMLDNGPEVLYYLANNIDEAKAIANAGPVLATIALGKLEAQIASQKTPKPVKKVTTAPEPPATRVRGTTGKFDVADDTDDLEAFERKFFQRK